MLGQQRKKKKRNYSDQFGSLSPGSFLVFTEKKKFGRKEAEGTSGGEGENLGFNWVLFFFSLYSSFIHCDGPKTEPLYS
jgi:hypothetical protein